LFSSEQTIAAICASFCMSTSVEEAKDRLSIRFVAVELLPKTERLRLGLSFPSEPLGLIGPTCKGEFSFPFALLADNAC
jgi:hypothetical protein